MKVVAPKWAAARQAEIDQCLKIDQTLSQNVAAQWLIVALTRVGRPFKVFNLGAGVKRITTETNVCPCCKKQI